MTITTELNGRLRAAADYLDAHGWTQGELRDDETGAVCATGAVMFCRPQVGDEHLIVQVLRHRGTAEEWNDEDGRTQEEVHAALSADITDEDLAATFGPQWAQVVALVRLTAGLTDDEVTRLDAARGAARAEARAEAWGAARGAARDGLSGAARGASRGAAWDAVGGAAWDAARYAARDAARYAARAAAWALVVRDLIGEHGFTQEHYDTLTGPWSKVTGKVHPDDEEQGA